MKIKILSAETALRVAFVAAIVCFIFSCNLSKDSNKPDNENEKIAQIDDDDAATDEHDATHDDDDITDDDDVTDDDDDITDDDDVTDDDDDVDDDDVDDDDDSEIPDDVPDDDDTELLDCWGLGGQCIHIDVEGDGCPEGYFLAEAAQSLCVTDSIMYCCLPDDDRFECRNEMECFAELNTCCGCGESEDEYLALHSSEWDEYYHGLCTEDERNACDRCDPNYYKFLVKGHCPDGTCRLKIQYPDPKPDHPKFYVCQNDSDCTAVAGGCCSCKDASINKNFSDEWYKWLNDEQDCDAVDCYYERQCTDVEPECQFGRCTLKAPLENIFLPSRCFDDMCYIACPCFKDRFGCQYNDLCVNEMLESIKCESDFDCEGYSHVRQCYYSETGDADKPEFKGDGFCHFPCETDADCFANRKCYKVDRIVDGKPEKIGLCFDLGF